MCLIIHREKDADISIQFLENVRERNPHGWGILYKNREGQARVAKGLSMESFYKRYAKFLEHNAECVIHFRYATKGKVNRSNAHPYKVLGGDNPIYLMHNGTISIEGAEKKGELSDTRIFIKDILKPMLQNIKDPHKFIRSKHFEFMMESVAGDHSSRFVLFDYKGALFYGGWYKTTKNVWVSNTYAYGVDNPTRKAKTNYNSSDYDDYGYWCSTTRRYISYADSSKTQTFKAKADDSDKSNVNDAHWLERKYEGYGDFPDEQIDDKFEREWLDTIQDAADNFEVIAETYWALNAEEINFAINRFYEGKWVFELNSSVPQHSLIRDLDGNIVEPEDIELACTLLGAELDYEFKEVKKEEKAA